MNRVEQLISAEALAKRVDELALEIARTYSPNMLVVSLLRGSFVFTADLVRALHKAGISTHIDFMRLASYGNGVTTSGNVKVLSDLTEDVSGRDVLIVDDILESGLTLAFARNLLVQRGVKSAKIAVMLEKPGKRKTAIDADYVGFKIDDKFVVGYGLDHANNYRELPFIVVIPE